MKRKFYLHRVNAPLEADHVIYRLWVGESVREQRLLTRIMSWAFAQSATVMTWREDIDMYLLLESERIFGASGLLNFGFIQTDISATECLQLIETNSWDAFEKSLSLPRNLIHQLSVLDPIRVDKAKGRIRSIPLLTEKSKYLSQNEEGRRNIIRFN